MSLDRDVPGARAAERYPLRDRDTDEVARLALQHRVWRAQTQEALDLADFGSGDVVADLGCGAGDLSLDLANLVGAGGRVHAVDGSAYFIGVLDGRAGEAGIDWIEPKVADLTAGWRCPEDLDGALCRWVLMFLPDTDRLVRQVAECLAPGGRFVAMEYFNFGSTALHPHGEAFARTYDAVARLIRAGGGDPDIGSKLPALFADAGLEVTAIRSVLRTGRPGDDLWAWLEATHRNHSNLVDAGLLTEAELAEYHAEWAEAVGNPGAFFNAPPMVAVVGRKPR